MHLMENEPTYKYTKRDASDPAACTCANLRQATRIVTQAFDAALRPTGLKATQFTLLATLAGAGDMPMVRLAEVLVMDRTTLSRNLKPLIRRKLIRIENADDQRVRNIHLTETGRHAFEEALPKWKLVQIQLTEKLGLDHWSTLMDDLSATVAALQDH